MSVCQTACPTRLACGLARAATCALASNPRLTSCPLPHLPAHLTPPPPSWPQVIEEDEFKGDANGPFDAQTSKEKREDAKREKVRVPLGALCVLVLRWHAVHAGHAAGCVQ